MVQSEAVELDNIDRALIAALIQDGRATYAALAPKVELSQAAVRTRVQRLLDEQVITVTGRVDPASFGLGVFVFVFLEVSGELDKVAARVADIDDSVFVVEATGRFDLLVELRCHDNDGLLAALDQVRVLEGVRRLQSAKVLHYEKQDWTNVANAAAQPIARPQPAPAHELDDIDRRLLRELMADGRATYATLATLVDLSQAAVRDRVIDLLESDVVTIQAHPVPEAMGIGGFAGLAVKATGPVGPLATFVAEMPESCLVVRTLGRFDLLAEIWFDDDDHLAEILDRLREVQGMGSIDTVPYLRIALESFGPGARQASDR